MIKSLRYGSIGASALAENFPAIVKSGLVIYFDAANSPSYNNSGENLVSYSTYNASAWSNPLGATGTITTGIGAPDGTNTAIRYTFSNTGNAILRVAIPAFTPNGTDTYTISFYVRKISGTGSLSTDLTDGNPSKSYNSELITNEWVRIVTSGIPTATSKTFIDLISDTNTNYVLDFWGVQLEKKSTASNYTPTSGSTVTGANTWTDLSSSRVATLSNVTYSSSTMAYNGTSSTASFNISNINFASEQTIMMGLMPNENDANRRNPYNHEYAGYGTITHEVDGFFSYYHGTSGGNGATYQGTGSSFTVVQNEIAIIAVTRGSTNIKWYKNGALGNTTANSYPTAVTSVSTANIGNGYAGFYSGNIYFLLMYNRQLSDLEINQNYNAFRIRYGI